MPAPMIMPTMMHIESKRDSSFLGAMPITGSGESDASVRLWLAIRLSALKFLKRHADPGPLFVKDCFQVRIGGDRRDVVLDILPATAHIDVVGQNQAPGTHEWQQLVEVIDVAFLVRVNENDVDLLFELRNFLVGVALDKRDEIIDAGPFEVLAGQRCPASVDLVSCQLASCLLQG